MMQLGTKSRYALRALIELALNGLQAPVSRAKLAAAQGISPDYMAQLFRQLQAAGIIRGVKGPGGGYLLGRDAANISAGDVVRAVEGDIALAPCGECLDGPCPRAAHCVARTVWDDAARALCERLDSWTLAMILEQARSTDGADLAVDEEQ